MKRVSTILFSLFFLFTLAFAKEGLHFGFQETKPATVKVLLLKDAPNAYIEVQGNYILQNIDTEAAITAIRNSRKGYVLANNQSLYWDEEIPMLHHVRILPCTKETILLVNGIQYKGCVEVHNFKGKISVVNEVDIENFLIATIPTKYAENLPQDVLQALAIIERTSLYFIGEKKPKAFYQFDAEEIGFQGRAPVENSYAKAVNATRNVILTYEGHPFPAVATQDSAGKTSDYASIFRKNVAVPPGVQVPDTYLGDTPKTWVFQMSKEEFGKLFQIPEMSAIDIFSDKKSEKVYAVRLHDESTSQDIDFFTLQKTLGADKLLSNGFSVELENDQLIFSGQGVGHGVGLCVKTATLMAQEGCKASKILFSFFPGVELQRIRKAKASSTEK